MLNLAFHSNSNVKPEPIKDTRTKHNNIIGVSLLLTLNWHLPTKVLSPNFASNNNTKTYGFLRISGRKEVKFTHLLGEAKFGDSSYGYGLLHHLNVSSE